MIPSLHPLTNRLRRRMAAAVAVALTAFLPLAVPTVPTAQASDLKSLVSPRRSPMVIHPKRQ